MHADMARRTVSAVTITVLVCVLGGLLPALVASCCGSAGTDSNEPNNELNNATYLKPVSPLDGHVGGTKDIDIFRADAPAGDQVKTFTVTIKTATPDKLDVQVGASIPGVWEGITWPGWKPRPTPEGLQVDGSLKAGTVLVFIKGTSGTPYTITIVWEDA